MFLTFSGCVKERDAQVKFNHTLSNVSVNSIDFSVGYSVDQGKIEFAGLVYSFKENPEIKPENYYARNTWMINFDDISGAYNGSLSELEDNGYYFLRFFVVVEGKVYYSEQLDFVTDCPGMGRGPAGGYIIYEDGNGGGLEAAPMDIDYQTSDDYYGYQTRYQWGCLGLSMSATASSIFTGEENTNLINSNCFESNIAAKGCEDYTFNGYGDWFLPSEQELLLIYNNLHTSGIGKLANDSDSYWSSTEVDNQQAITINFYSGFINSSNKTSQFAVRPIRKF